MKLKKFQFKKLFEIKQKEVKNQKVILKEKNKLKDFFENLKG